MNAQVLNDKQLRNANGGGYFAIFDGGAEYPDLSKTYYHENCGGVIENVGDPFASCVCSVCGEKHYLLTGFKTYTLELHTKE